MTNQVGFDFDEFGGNVDVVIVDSTPDILNQSTYLTALPGEPKFTQQQGQGWSFFNSTAYPPDGAEAVAKALSQEVSTKAIYFYFGDASGWMGYKLFINGDEVEDYSFGVNYDEELIEMGLDPAVQVRKENTLVTTDETGNQYVFWSQIRSKSESEICSGEAFIDEFLRSHNAYIGWDLFPER